MAQLIHSILSVAANTVPGALAATLEDEAVTFAEVVEQTARYANALDTLGLRRGDRLMVQAEFTLAQLPLYFATQYLGVAFAPANPAFSPEEFGRIVDYLRPAAVVQDAFHAEMPGRPGGLHLTLGNVAPEGSVALGPLVAQATATPRMASPTQEDDIHAIFLTSGSTGQPKGVMLSHRTSWMRSHLGASRFVCAGGRGEVLTFPMFHWAGWNYLMENWAHKRALHFVPDTSGEAIAQAVRRHDPAFLYAIPAVWERILACGDGFDGSRLRAVGSGTSRFDPALLERIAAACPKATRGVFYGSTEFGGTCTLIEDEIANRPGSVGLPGAGIDARIVEGELQLSGPTAMQGYFDLPTQTREVMQDGWYRTGDLAERDADGFISITGRAREIIRSGGETVAPAEVELALKGFPGLRGVAVVGLDDPVWGEVVCAVAELEEGAPCPEVDRLRAFLDGRIAAYKHPRRVLSLPELPRTPATGQIMRSRVKQMVQGPN